MLKFLLDENISKEVAYQVSSKREDIVIFSVHDWNGGVLVGAKDERIIRDASEHIFTVVTRDINTIAPLLIQLSNEGFSHAGVIFIDTKTIRPKDIGSLIRALIQTYDDEADFDWTDRIFFLS